MSEDDACEICGASTINGSTTCRDCGAECCRFCMPAGVGTRCVNCEPEDDE